MAKHGWNSFMIERRASAIVVDQELDYLEAEALAAMNKVDREAEIE